MTRTTDEQRRRRFATRHRLTPSSRATTVPEVADAVVALHSSDPASVYLAAAARLREPTVDLVADAIHDERSVVRHHAMRRTLWVMGPDVALAANAGFTRRIADAERRRTGVLFGETDEWVAQIVDRVVDAVDRSGGPISTREVGQAVPDLAEPRTVNAGRSGEGTMAPHARALLLAAFETRIVRGRQAGSWIGSQYSWWPASAWRPMPWSAPDEATGIAEIVGRYLDRFGPATTDDVVWWTGASRARIGAALTGIGAIEVALDDGSAAWVLPSDDTDDDTDDDMAEPWVALLPALDPTAMGWKRREWYLDPAIAARVTDRNGNIGPTVWADGRIVGGWVQRPDGTIAHDATSLSGAHAALLADEIGRLRAFVGDTRFRVRFPAPNQRTLLA